MELNLKTREELLKNLPDDDKAKIDQMLNTTIWEPTAGRQYEAYASQADILFYGGAAGGGKSDLLLGLALTQHTKSIIFRREATQLQGLLDRMTQIMGNRDGFNGTSLIWRLSTGQLEFGSCKNIGDEQKFQGRDHDGVFFDEITHFQESQFRYLQTWLRTTRKDTRCRVVCTGNPPTCSDGEWVRKFWSPWLDDQSRNKAKPGELRWYTTINGEDIECENGDAFLHEGQMLKPKSRTFIPSRVGDNPFLADGYTATLQALPEPLRSQMLYGDFSIGSDADPWQVIPTEWVVAAQERWVEEFPDKLDAMGVDPARGGVDETVIARRYGR